MHFYKELITQCQKTKADLTVQITLQQATTYCPTSLEPQIINHACQGLTNKEIGELVHLSGRTVEGHIKKRTEKFKVKTRFN